jgi:adenine-specific DNA-methyltransferase
MNENNNKTKKIGQIFTPQYIVEEMLDYIGYIGENILEKHIIDNSCGDGAFLTVAVRRYCDVFLSKNDSLVLLKRHLELYFHGIDTDEIAYKQCIQNLNQIAGEYGVQNVKWDLYNQSSLSMIKFNGKMDFVIGNPPYVRVHNLDSTYDEVKKYKFANGGMTDLYLAFFELGFYMLNDCGKLCYITPSSWLNSVAAENMRNYILKQKTLVSLTDLEHFQAFENATTYTLISLFAKNKSDKNFDYYVFNGNTKKRELIDNISLDDCYIDSYFYLSDKKHLEELKDIKTKKTLKYVSVKNGFATLADKVFIGNNIPQTKITIRTLKASTGKWYNCLFPYDKKGKLLPRNEVFSDPVISSYFETHKEEILKGKPEYPTYYEFGRTQALLDVWRDKVAINTLVRNENDLKIEIVKSGEGLYSGLYIISDLEIPFDDLKNILKTKDFVDYVRLLKKYKSGGYYTFNSKDVQQYINYYITFKTSKKYDKSRFSKQNPSFF